MSLLGQTIKKLSYEGTESLGLFLSWYRAMVTKNDDPENMGRVQVVIPGIIDEDLNTWIMPIGNWGGKNYGVHVLPQVGSIVYVTFEMGDTSKPLWMHGYHAQGEVPEGYGKPNHFWFMTPGGATVEIDDDKKEITINDHHGNSIECNSNGVSIDVKSSKNKIFLGDINKADEPAVLGDTLESLLKDLIDNQVEINKQLKSLGNEVVKALRGIGIASPAQVYGGTVTARATTLAAKLNKVYATVKAKNKSIMTTYNKLKDFKSQTVKLDK